MIGPGEPEHRTSPGLGFNGNLSFVVVEYFFYNGQPYARTFKSVALLQRLKNGENFAEMLLLNSNAIIGHRKFVPAADRCQVMLIHPCALLLYFKALVIRLENTWLVCKRSVVSCGMLPIVTTKLEGTNSLTSSYNRADTFTFSRLRFMRPMRA